MSENVSTHVDVLKLLPSKTKPKRKIPTPNQTPKATLSLTKSVITSETKSTTKRTRNKKPVKGNDKIIKGNDSINVKGNDKVTDEEKRRKKLFKEEMKAAKRRDAENKRIEKQIIEAEQKRRQIIENRRKAIIADRLKQKAINESSNNDSTGITTQMGSFKMKNVGIHKNNNVVNDEIELIPLGNGGFKVELSKPKSIISRRIDQYARRELDPSIVPIFNEMLQRKYLQMKINS